MDLNSIDFSAQGAGVLTLPLTQDGFDQNGEYATIVGGTLSVDGSLRYRVLASALTQRFRYRKPSVASLVMLPKKEATIDTVSKPARKELAEALRRHYKGASKTEKRVILDEFTAVSG